MAPIHGIHGIRVIRGDFIRSFYFFSYTWHWQELCCLAGRNRRVDRSPTMSCRIDRVVSDGNRVVLLVSGRIRGEHVDMLRGVLERESGGFAIDLKNVLLVDRQAVKLLALSEANGTELRNCPPYIREWVTRERAETHRRPSEQRLESREDMEDA